MAGLTNVFYKVFDFNIPRFASIGITQRDVSDASPLQFAINGTGDDVLNPPAAPTGTPTDYVRINYFEDLVRKGGFGFDPVTHELIIPVDGWYEGSGWSAFRHDANNSTISFVFGFRMNDTDPYNFSQRPTPNKKPNNNDLGQISGGGDFYAKKGTRISVWFASDNNGVVTIPNANLRVRMLRHGAM